MAPPTTAAIPAVKMGGGVVGDAGDANNCGGYRNDAVIRAEHPGAEPVQAFGEVLIVWLIRVGLR